MSEFICVLYLGTFLKDVLKRIWSKGRFLLSQGIATMEMQCEITKMNGNPTLPALRLLFWSLLAVK